MSDIELTGAKPRQMFMGSSENKIQRHRHRKTHSIIGFFLQNVTLDGQAFMRHE